MALISCYECGHQVSDRAAACPQCGAPVEKPSHTLGGVSSVDSARSLRDLRNAIDAKAPPKNNSTRPSEKIKEPAGIAKGLRQLSAAFWGFIALVAILFSIALASDHFRVSAALGIGYFVGSAGIMLGIIYAMHNLTCWIINGFSEKKA